MKVSSITPENRARHAASTQTPDHDALYQPDFCLMRIPDLPLVACHTLLIKLSPHLYVMGYEKTHKTLHGLLFQPIAKNSESNVDPVFPFPGEVPHGE